MFLLVSITIGFASNLLSKEKMKYPITNIHKAIVQEAGWLNVSRPLEAQDLKGRVILLDFWTFCCINCIHIMPDLKYLEKKFGDKLTVIGVHSAKFNNEKDSENIRQAILRYELEHPVVNDYNFRIWNSFGVRSWPTLMLINPLGKLSQVYSGEGHRAEIERDIASLLKIHGDKVNSAPLPYDLEKDKAPKSVLNFPSKLEYAEDIKTLFISDSNNNRILGVDLNGKITVEIGSGKSGNKDGSFATAKFNRPQGILYAAGKLYIADTENHILREADLTSQKVKTIAGTGKQGHNRSALDDPALKTALASPWDLAFYPDEHHIAIAMAGTHQLWSYNVTGKTVSILAGNGRESIDDGSYPYNSLSQPSGLVTHKGKLYFVDSETSSLRVLSGKKITTLIGSGLFDFGYVEGKKGTALMQHPLGLTANDGGIYIADSYNHSIRHYDIKKGVLSNFVGDGKRSAEFFSEPNDIVKIGNKYYVADTNHHQIKVIDSVNKEIGILPIMPKYSKSKPQFTTSIPNSAKLELASLKPNAQIKFTLQLQSGWHINDDAPSYLALFETSGKTPKLIADFDRVALGKSPLNLPKLELSKTYELQGIFYYCPIKDGALCLIKGYSQPIKVGKKGQDTLSFKLN